MTRQSIQYSSTKGKSINQYIQPSIAQSVISMQFNEQLKIVGQPADFDVMSHVRKGIIYAGKHACTVHIYTHNTLYTTQYILLFKGLANVSAFQIANDFLMTCKGRATTLGRN